MVATRRGLVFLEKEVGHLVGIAHAMTAEIVFENDECPYLRVETTSERWIRMRNWVERNLEKSNA